MSDWKSYPETTPAEGGLGEEFRHNRPRPAE